MLPMWALTPCHDTVVYLQWWVSFFIQQALVSSFFFFLFLFHSFFLVSIWGGGAGTYILFPFCEIHDSYFACDSPLDPRWRITKERGKEIHCQTLFCPFFYPHHFMSNITAQIAIFIKFFSSPKFSFWFSIMFLLLSALLILIYSCVRSFYTFSTIATPRLAFDYFLRRYYFFPTLIKAFWSLIE